MARSIHAVVTAGLVALLLAGCGPARTTAPLPVNPPPPAGPQQPTPPNPTPPAGTAPRSISDPREKQKVVNDLRQIGLAYINYWTGSDRGPSKVDELYSNLDGPKSPMSKGLASGKYKVYLNASVAQMPAGTSMTILGYYAGEPGIYSGVTEARGPVLMADGRVVDMDPSEFKAAPKAGQ
jgi:hypothetical protein